MTVRAPFLRSFVSLAAFLVFGIPFARAQDVAPESASVAARPPLAADDLAEKRSGFYVTGVPLAGYSPDEGLGLGARIYGYWDGERTDPLFAYTPYRHRVYVQGYATFLGVQSHEIDWDAPFFGNSDYRVRASLGYERWKTLRYYGHGESSLGGRVIPGLGAFATDAEYDAAASALLPGGNAYSHYGQYALALPQGSAAIERSFFGGTTRVQLGLLISYGMPREDTGLAVDAIDRAGSTESATELPTAARLDCLAGKIHGCGSSWANAIKIGIAYDTRDYEPDPRSGLFADATTELASPAVGASATYARASVAVRGFIPLFPRATRLVLAARGLVAITGGDVPYWDAPTIALTDGDIRGLGGLRTLRGYRLDRFVGNVVADANLELRWTAARFAVAGERFHVILAPFGDAGRVFDSVGRATLLGWKPDAGAALRIAWNLATIVSADYAVSPEGSGLYIDFGHQF